MKHYVTGYKPGNDELVFKIRMPLELAQLREIMQWQDDGECVFENLLNKSHVQQIEKESGLLLPNDLILFLTTESD